MNVEQIIILSTVLGVVALSGIVGAFKYPSFVKARNKKELDTTVSKVAKNDPNWFSKVGSIRASSFLKSGKGGAIKSLKRSKKIR